MSQNDFTLANQGFPSMRADMNSAYQALASNNSGATAPTTTFAHQWWYDTTNSLLMIRNAGNTAFEEFSAGGGGIVYVEKTANYTASAGEGIIADTSAGPFNLNLPATPASGDVVVIADGADWATNNLTVGRNGNTIEGNSSNLTLNVGGASVTFIYASNNWQVYTQMGGFGKVVVEGSSPTFAKLTMDATNPAIVSSDVDGFLTVSGDSTASTGTNIRIYSASHAGNANNIIFRNGNTATLKYDSSATSWNFQANDLNTNGTMTATDFVGDGSALTGITSSGVFSGGWSSFSTTASLTSKFNELGGAGLFRIFLVGAGGSGSVTDRSSPTDYAKGGSSGTSAFFTLNWNGTSALSWISGSGGAGGSGEANGVDGGDSLFSIAGSTVLTCQGGRGSNKSNVTATAGRSAPSAPSDASISDFNGIAGGAGGGVYSGTFGRLSSTGGGGVAAFGQPASNCRGGNATSGTTFSATAGGGPFGRGLDDSGSGAFSGASSPEISTGTTSTTISRISSASGYFGGPSGAFNSLVNEGFTAGFGSRSTSATATAGTGGLLCGGGGASTDSNNSARGGDAGAGGGGGGAHKDEDSGAVASAGDGGNGIIFFKKL